MSIAEIKHICSYKSYGDTAEYAQSRLDGLHRLQGRRISTEYNTYIRMYRRCFHDMEKDLDVTSTQVDRIFNIFVRLLGSIEGMDRNVLSNRVVDILCDDVRFVDAGLDLINDLYVRAELILNKILAGSEWYEFELVKRQTKQGRRKGIAQFQSGVIVRPSRMALEHFDCNTVLATLRLPKLVRPVYSMEELNNPRSGLIRMSLKNAGYTCANEDVLHALNKLASTKYRINQAAYDYFYSRMNE